MKRKIPYVFIDSTLQGMHHKISFIVQNSLPIADSWLQNFLIITASKLNSIDPYWYIITKELENNNHLLQREKGFYELFQ